jgi:hypothetical protein
MEHGWSAGADVATEVLFAYAARRERCPEEDEETSLHMSQEAVRNTYLLMTRRMFERYGLKFVTK